MVIAQDTDVLPKGQKKRKSDECVKEENEEQIETTVVANTIGRL